METPEKTAATERVSWWIVAATLFLSAVAAVPAGDTFRMPKEAVVRTAAIALLALLALTAIWRGRPEWLDLRRQWLVYPAAAVAWTLVSFAFSGNHLVSIQTVIDVMAGATLFVFMVAVARRRGSGILAALFIPALINAVVLILQKEHLWEPFHYTVDLPERMKLTALIGNPDDVGMYFAPVAIAAIAVALSARGWPRVLAAATALAALVAIGIAQTLTALGALAAGLAALALVALRRKAILGLAVLIVVGVVGLMTTSAGMRIRTMGWEIAHGRVPVTISGRALAIFASAAMFRDAPLLGVGPGCFAWEYFPYRLQVDQRWPSLRGSTQSNYGEAHNDHAQLLAETGLPGYLIFIAALIALGAASFKGNGDDDERRRYTRLVALPTAVTAAVIGVALFPLHIAAARMALLFIAATVAAWRLDAPASD